MLKFSIFSRRCFLKEPIFVIGAGLCGLSAALEIEAVGESAVIIDQSSRIGGRLKSTVLEDSYILDLGFQILIPSYPELRRFVDLDAKLNLKYFNSGARIEARGNPHVIANPVFHPSHLITSLSSPCFTARDKFLLMKLAIDVMKSEDNILYKEESTAEYFESYGFSRQAVENFWHPFFSGIFLDEKLLSSSAYFRFLLPFFMRARVAVPQAGIGELPKFLASRLQNSDFQLSTSVKSVTNNGIEFDSGKFIKTKSVVDLRSHDDLSPFIRGCVTTFWFASPEPPFQGAWLSLNPRKSASRLINHVAVLSNVSKKYASRGDSLIAVNVLRPITVKEISLVLSEAKLIYGSSVDHWRILRVDTISHAEKLCLPGTGIRFPCQESSMKFGQITAKRMLEKIL